MDVGSGRRVSTRLRGGRAHVRQLRPRVTEHVLPRTTSPLPRERWVPRAQHRRQGRVTPRRHGRGMDTTTDTHCPYCSLQCGMRLAVAGDYAMSGGGTAPGGGLPHVVERPEFPVNRGALCGKGRSAAALLGRASRLTTPLLRVRGGLRAASWDEALDRVAGASPRSGPSTAPTRSASSGAAGSPTRRRTSWASSPGWCWVPPTSTTTGASACPRPPPGIGPPSAWTAGCPSRWRTSPAPSA